MTLNISPSTTGRSQQHQGPPITGTMHGWPRHAYVPSWARPNVDCATARSRCAVFLNPQR